jgi:AcrR family transcriptional regulator
MSKSGLFAHFRSKEALQIAIIEEAERMFYEAVVNPSQAEPMGLPKVAALLRSYLDYAATCPFEGGCFFAAAAHEFDGRPGPVRDRIAGFYAGFQGHVSSALSEASRMGQLRAHVDVEAITFEVIGLGLAANLHVQLLGPSSRDHARDSARAAIKSLVDRIASIN